MGVDIEQLIKILNMTQSDNDNEALTAIRMANRMLKKNESGWAAVIVKVSSRQEEMKKQARENPEQSSTSYKNAPTKFDRGFWNSASEHQDWLKGLTEESQKTIHQMRVHVLFSGALPDKHWKNFKKAWDEYAERSRR